MGENLLTNETLDVKTVALRNFFDSLPENQSQPCRIDRETLDDLIERGVTVEDVCNEFVRRGFLLHGSGACDVAVLEPRQANDEGGYEENLRNAVYATDDPRIPIFMALRSGIEGQSQYSIIVSEHDDGTSSEEARFSTSFEIPTNKSGSVYVLPRDTFEAAGSDSQFTSLVPVIPAYEIPVTVRDFQYPIEKTKK
jgi:hypothetical protein